MDSVDSTSAERASVAQAELTRPHIARGPHSDKATVAANPPVATTAESDSANELIQRASQKIRGGDWAGAAALLDQAKAKDPKAKGLWASYGWIASAHRKYDEAIADYKKDLELDPENRAPLKHWPPRKRRAAIAQRHVKHSRAISSVTPNMSGCGSISPGCKVRKEK